MATDRQANNANPHMFERCGERRPAPSDEDEGVRDPIDDWEVFDLIRWIADPEHPELSLEELGVVERSGVEVKDAAGESSTVEVRFTPTVPHCSMATLIGLSVMARLQRALPDRFKVDVCVAPGTHDAEGDVNMQLADKERVAAALENSHILKVVDRCLADKHRW